MAQEDYYGKCRMATNLLGARAAHRIDSTKKLLLMESGVRFHLTSFTRDKSDNPSPFTMKLRKHLRGKRLNNVKQLGMDRVVALVIVAANA